MENAPELAVSIEAKKTRVWPKVILWSCAIALLMGTAGYFLWAIHRINARMDDLSFDQTLDEYSRDNDLLSPDVGVIQFMHRGYTVTFTTIAYTPSGLQVEGTLGNPTQLALYSINLKLSARTHLYQVRDKVVRDPFFIFTNSLEIGSAAESIPYLGTGKTAEFSMTIPNVKQTQDGFDVAVSFSGERYSY